MNSDVFLGTCVNWYTSICRILALIGAQQLRIWSSAAVCRVQTYRDPQTPSAELVLRLFHLPFFSQHPTMTKIPKQTKNPSTVNSILMPFLEKLGFSITDWLPFPTLPVPKTNWMSSSFPHIRFRRDEWYGVTMAIVNMCSYCALGPMQKILIWS